MKRSTGNCLFYWSLRDLVDRSSILSSVSATFTPLCVRGLVYKVKDLKVAENTSVRLLSKVFLEPTDPPFPSVIASLSM